jgi:tight adherence protein B
MTEEDVFYAFAVVTGILIVEAVYLLFSDAKSNRDRVNRRMRISGPDANRQEVLIKIRKERGLSGSGENRLGAEWLSALVVQAGLTLGLPKLAMFAAASALVAGAGTYVYRGSAFEALAALAFGGGILPLLVLRSMRARRQKAFGDQLPEAIELIVRSLKAGHPVPVAIGLVSRELPDPVGTEFGMVADEVTYGSDLVTALRKMQVRVGQEDLPLFITAVSIQSSTGGNLREILQGLADVIRQRIKMRRKIRSISAEGRISAYFLTALPPLLLLVINLMSPEYYGEVWAYLDTKLGLAGAGVWLLGGNILMRRMVNFRF